MSMNYIDLHTHGLSGRDTHSGVPENYLAMAESFMANGTGAFLPTLFPCPLKEMRAQLSAIKAAMEEQSRGGGGARILGAHIEGPFVNPEKCGALDRESFLAATPDNLERLTGGFADVVRIITVAPELPGALGVIEKASGKGIRVNMGHSAATFAEAREGARAGATGVTHLFNAMSGLHHREPGLAGYALMDDNLYVEIIADLVHVHPEMLRLVVRCKPADRVILVSDSLGEARTDRSPGPAPLYMPDGTTLAGSGITLADAVANMTALGVPLETAESFASVNPAGYMAPA